MQSPRINLIHALTASITPIEDVFARTWPEAVLVNLLDDSLSVDVARDGKITEAMTQRFIDLTRYAVATGADAVLFTCSAFNQAKTEQNPAHCSRRHWRQLPKLHCYAH